MLLPGTTRRGSTRKAIAAWVLLSLLVAGRGVAADREVAIKEADGRLQVLIDGELFTEYVYRVINRPVLYPIIGPHGIGMTRNFPMKKDVAGEPQDHPHHTSLWYAHNPAGGVDCFSTLPGAGRIVHDKVLQTRGGPNRGVIKTTSNWVAPDGKVLLTDTRVLAFQLIAGWRAIDWEITLEASHGDVTFGDSDHGGLAIRMHPSLQLVSRPGEGMAPATGQALNSEGIRADASAGISGGPVWGKRARWIDYWGEVDGKTVGIAILDHPANPRHPTHWMARGYGYCAACPFGLHSFDKKPLGTGDLTIEAGESVTFRYRLIFHEGSATEANVERLWQQYAKAASPTAP